MNDYFPGEEKPLHNSWPDQEHSPGGRHTVSKSTINRRVHKIDGSPQHVNHCGGVQSQNHKNCQCPDIQYMEITVRVYTFQLYQHLRN